MIKMIMNLVMKAVQKATTKTILQISKKKTHKMKILRMTRIIVKKRTRDIIYAVISKIKRQKCLKQFQSRLSKMILRVSSTKWKTR